MSNSNRNSFIPLTRIYDVSNIPYTPRALWKHTEGLRRLSLSCACSSDFTKCGTLDQCAWEQEAVSLAIVFFGEISRWRHGSDRILDMLRQTSIIQEAKESSLNAPPDGGSTLGPPSRILTPCRRHRHSCLVHAGLSYVIAFAIADSSMLTALVAYRTLPMRLCFILIDYIFPSHNFKIRLKVMSPTGSVSMFLSCFVTSCLNYCSRRRIAVCNVLRHDVKQDMRELLDSCGVLQERTGWPCLLQFSQKIRSKLRAVLEEKN